MSLKPSCPPLFDGLSFLRAAVQTKAIDVKEKHLFLRVQLFPVDGQMDGHTQKKREKHSQTRQTKPFRGLSEIKTGSTSVRCIFQHNPRVPGDLSVSSNVAISARPQTAHSRPLSLRAGCRRLIRTDTLGAIFCFVTTIRATTVSTLHCTEGAARTL